MSVFAEVSDTATTTTLPVVLEPAPTPDLLVGLLEEVIYIVDVFGKVPAHVHLAESEGGGMAGDLGVVEVADVVLIGSVPKAVSWHGLEIGEDGGNVAVPGRRGRMSPRRHLVPDGPERWRIDRTGAMRVPGVVYASVRDRPARRLGENGDPGHCRR